MSAAASDTYDLHRLNINRESSLNSQRSSLDYAAPDHSDCRVSIFEQLPSVSNAQIPPVHDELVSSDFNVPYGNTTQIPDALNQMLKARPADRTRWINFTQWSPALVQTLSSLYLDNHGCLDLHYIGSQVRGGPIRTRTGGHFIWIQTSVPFIDRRSRSWSSLQQCGLKMVVSLPTRQQAGTIITNFTGKSAAVEQISRAMIIATIHEHAMGSDIMGCVWTLAYSIIQSIARQMDTAFRLFDPLDSRDSVTHFTRLPLMLERWNELARVDRYISGIAEILDFLDAVCTFQSRSNSTVEPNHVGSSHRVSDTTRLPARTQLEMALTRQKVTGSLRLCHTYMEQHNNHVQTMLSYSTTKIADRLDSGRKIAERIAYIGVVLASISGLTSPLAVITGYFGMNVSQFTSGGQLDLFDFWQIAGPLCAITGLIFCVILLRLITRLK